MLLGIDIGTTHCKAGLFDLDGGILRLASREMKLRKDKAGFSFYNSEEVFSLVVETLLEVCSGFDHKIKAIGIASMAETGMLIDARTGLARTPLYPWFDPLAADEAENIKAYWKEQGAFIQRGIRPTFKCSLAKLMWSKFRDPTILEGAKWLSTADSFAFYLTGKMATDRTLAQRTAAYRIDQGIWNTALLKALELPVDIFPPIMAPLEKVGDTTTKNPLLKNFKECPVWIAGHDHVVGAFAAQTLGNNLAARFIFNSIGTAESLLGVFPERSLDELDVQSQFAFGPYLLGDFNYWMGGISASGGSLEWLRTILADPPLDYSELANLMVESPRQPGKILYFPYLAGSGSPHQDNRVRAAFIGLGTNHNRGDIYQAVLEGISFEARYIRDQAKKLSGDGLGEIIAAGGGTRNQLWMQIKADIYGCPVFALEQPETTLLGAALYAGLGAGIYRNQQDIAQCLSGIQLRKYMPDSERVKIYQEIYENKYLGFQDILREKSR